MTNPSRLRQRLLSKLLAKETRVVKLTINEAETQFETELTVAELLEHLQLAGKPVAVELNLELIPSDEHVSTRLQDGDRLEIVSLTGGG